MPSGATPRAGAGGRRELALAALVGLSALVGLFLLPRLFPAGGRLLGKPAPDFALPVVANGAPGARMRLSEIRERVVVLDFWASWCEPCALQGQILEQVARRHAAEALVLGINVDDPPEVASRYARTHGLTYPILADLDGSTQRAYGVGGLPSIVVVDRRGQVAGYLQGLVRRAELERVIEEGARGKGQGARED